MPDTTAKITDTVAGKLNRVAVLTKQKSRGATINFLCDTYFYFEENKTLEQFTEVEKAFKKYLDELDTKAPVIMELQLRTLISGLVEYARKKRIDIKF